MLTRLMQLFETDAEEVPPETHALPEAVATLLAEIALSDGLLADEESEKLTRLIEKRFKLSAADAAAIADRGLAHARASTDMFRAVRRVNDGMSEAEKIDLMTDLWRIVLADGRIDDFEAALMRKLAGLLYIRDQDAGRARKLAEEG